MASEYFLRWTMKHRSDTWRNWRLVARLYLIHLASLKTCGWTTLQCSLAHQTSYNVAQLGVRRYIYLPDWHKGVFYKRQAGRPTSHYKPTTTSITDTYTQCITVWAARTDWLYWKLVLIRARGVLIITMKHGWCYLRWLHVLGWSDPQKDRGIVQNVSVETGN